MARFQKGKSGNPKGRPKLMENEKRIRELARKHLFFLLEKLMLSKTDFEKYLKSNNASMFAVMLNNSISKHDHEVWKEIMNRLMGKAPEVIQTENINTNTEINVNDLPKDQAEKIVLAYLEKIREGN